MNMKGSIRWGIGTVAEFEKDAAVNVGVKLGFEIRAWTRVRVRKDLRLGEAVRVGLQLRNS